MHLLEVLTDRESRLANEHSTVRCCSSTDSARPTTNGGKTGIPGGQTDTGKLRRYRIDGHSLPGR